MESQDAESMPTAFFDAETLLWRMDGERDDAKAVLRAFSLESQKLLAEIDHDIAQRNAYALRTHAEMLHEKASTISSTIIKYHAHRLAHFAECNDFASAEKTLPRLASSFRILNGKLREDGWLA